MDMTMKVRLDVSDPLLRQALLAVLDAETGFGIVAARVGGKEVAADLLIVDSSSAEPSVCDRIRSVRRRQPRTRAIVVMTQPTGESIQSAIAAGASGVVSRTQPMRELLGAIRVVAQGGSYLCPNVICSP
jgi:two-component system response regulator DegU